MDVHPRLATVFLLVVIGFGVSAGSVSAQYFGTNKVQYKELRFEVLETEHFDVYFYAGEREGAELAARLAERWYTRLAELFDHRLRGRQPLVLYASQVDFQQTQVIPASSRDDEITNWDDVDRLAAQVKRFVEKQLPGTNAA